MNNSNRSVNAIQVPFSEAVDNGTYVGTNNVFNHNAVEVFPNPFNEVTNINITLENPTEVNLQVFNAFGQLVTEMTRRFLGGAGAKKSLLPASYAPMSHSPVLQIYNLRHHNIEVRERLGEAAVKNNRKVTNILWILSGSFFLCWRPIFICVILIAFSTAYIRKNFCTFRA